MKKIVIFTIVMFGIMLSSANAKTFYRNYSDIDFFYSSLEPYGEWIEIGYDDYIWRPYRIDRNWRPYSEGRWEWTRNGWYWDSYEPFGWATYHYGRWYLDDYYGWVWMPDYEWAPAWVEWRYNNNYIGWAPLPPYAKYHYRTGISFSINWHSNYYCWNFVTFNHFTSRRVNNYFVQVNNVNRIYKNTKYRTRYFSDNNRIVNGGVSRRFVERKIGRKLTTKRINRTDDFTSYNRRDAKSSRGIVEYRPSEKSIKRTTIDRKNVTKGRKLKGLKRDKVVINRKSRLDKTVRKHNSKNAETKRSRNKVENMNYEKYRDKNEINRSSKKYISRSKKEQKYNNNKSVKRENKRYNRNSSKVEKRNNNEYKKSRSTNYKRKTNNLTKSSKKNNSSYRKKSSASYYKSKSKSKRNKNYSTTKRSISKKNSNKDETKIVSKKTSKKTRVSSRKK